MTTFSEAMLMSGIGRDLAIEGVAESLIQIALTAVQGQVPPEMETAVALQIMADSTSALACVSVMDVPKSDARQALVALANSLRDTALARLDYLHAQGTQE